MSDENWPLVKAAIAGWSEKKIRFSGKCPNCKKEAEFYVSAARNLKSGKALLAALNPKKVIWGYISQDLADFGYCTKCDKEAMKCPRCLSINPAEYQDSKCVKCGKEYTHP